jgi:ribosome-binding protein aMBF1 (putative translation factor)
MEDFEKFKKELLNDPEIKKEYDRLEPEFKLTETLIRKRLKKGLTQKELALKIGTKQSAISRLESGDQNPTIQLLQKVSKALGANLKISIQ